MEKELDETCSKAIEIVKDSDPDYFERFHSTIDSYYDLPTKPYHFTTEDLTKANTYSNVMLYDEEKGDACYARQMGTYIENGRFVLILKTLVLANGI